MTNIVAVEMHCLVFDAEGEAIKNNIERVDVKGAIRLYYSYPVIW